MSKMLKCIILFFPQHISCFIAASYKEELYKDRQKIQTIWKFYQNL